MPLNLYGQKWRALVFLNYVQCNKHLNNKKESVDVSKKKRNVKVTYLFL